MDKNEMAFLKQSLSLTRDWDDFQELIRRCRRICAGDGRRHPVRQ